MRTVQTSKIRKNKERILEQYKQCFDIKSVKLYETKLKKVKMERRKKKRKTKYTIY